MARAFPLLHVETPLLESPSLSAILGRTVLLKMECYQPVGSFKIRGMGALAREVVGEGARRLLCPSGGNAGLAVAHAGRKLGVPVEVVVPRTTPEWSRAMIRAEGATVQEFGESWDDANARAHEIVAASGDDLAYVHPFDDPRIWEGHATLVDEIVARGVRPGAVVVSVGGGGLLCGVLEGLHRHDLKRVPVYATETEGAASFRESALRGELVTLPAITSLATTLGARTVTPALLYWLEKHPLTPVTVSDRDAVEACLRFADDHRVLVEPACGAALATVYGRRGELEGDDPLVVIVCGGAGANRELLGQWCERVGIRA